MSTESPANIEEKIHELLSEVYLPEGVQIWLTHPNRNLGMETPDALISSGRSLAVLDEVKRLTGGGW